MLREQRHASHPALAIGTDAITATYSGDNEHSGSTGTLSGGQQVNQAATSITVTSVTPSSEAYGQDAPVTITAVLSWAGSGTPPIASAVTIGGNGPSTYGTTSCSAPSGTTITCTNIYTPTAADTPGSYTESAKFAGDGNYTGSSSSQTNNFSIGDATSSTAVTTSGTPSIYGQPVTFTATIGGEYGLVKGRKGPAGRNGAKPQIVSGSVTWSANTGCSTTTVTAGTPGTATCITSSLAEGNDAITATYSGDGEHSGSSGTLSGGQQVNQAATSITVTSVTPSSEAYGQDAPVTITAVLSWAGSGTPPTASDVTIGGNGPSAYGTTSCSAPSGTTITCTNTYTPSASDVPGSYTESAKFAGDTNYSSSSSSQSGNFSISVATSTTTVTSSANPSVYGQSVTFTATIGGEYGLVKGRNGPAGRNGVKPQIVSGSVTWSANTGCGTTPVTAGTPGIAKCTTSTLAIGTDAITATYSGDGDHSGSSGTLTGGQVVSKFSTTTTVTSSLNPLICKEKVSFTAKVANVAPGTGTPTGTVQFVIDGTNFGSPVTLTAGSATSGTTSTLTPGTHTVTAIYSGDTTHNGSTGTLAGGEVVEQAPAITSVNCITFTLGSANSFTVTTTGYPVPTITESGSLPAGVKFTNNGNGTGTLSGTPTVDGTFSIKFTASNGVGSAAVQTFVLTVSGPLASVTPTSINFGNVYLSNHATSENVTVKNTGNATLKISSVSLTLGTGTSSGEFSMSNACSSTLAAGASCTITVGFYGSAVGTPSATISVADNALGSPQTVSLSATVINPKASLTPSSLSFATTKVGSKSSAQNATLTNTGTTALTITSISITGADTKDFAQSNACSSPLAPTASCTIAVTFTPTAKGSRSASLTVVDNAQVATQSVALSGTGD